MATIYKRGKVWYIQYFLECRRIKRSLEVKSKQLAEMEKARIESELERGKLGLSTTRIAPLDALKEYKEEIVNTKSKPTTRRYIYSLKSFETFLLEQKGTRYIRDLTRKDLERMLKTRGEKISAKTYNEELGLIKLFFQWCINQNYILENPAEKIPRKHRVPPPPRAFTSEEIELILSNTNEQHRDVYEFLLNTGLRSGELANLEWTDVDLENNIIHIRIKKDWYPKTITNRTVPLNSRARKLILRQPRKSKYVFSTKTGGQYNDLYNRFAYLIKKIAKKHGVEIKDANIHTFRHSFATHCLMSGIDIYTVSRYLGHTSVKMTEKYLTLLPDYAKQEIEKLQFKSNSGSLKLTLD